MKQFKFKIVSVFFLSMSILLFCKSEGDNPVNKGNKSPKYKAPVETNDGWETSTFENENIDPEFISGLLDKIESDEFQEIHSIVIARNEKLLFERYFTGHNSANQEINYGMDVLHGTASCTKSFTSCLTGIALYKGFITSIDQKIYDLFPDYEDLKWEGMKKDITIRHLLTMSAGLSWDEWTYGYSDSRNSNTQMDHKSDPVKYVLELSMITEPGAEFRYNSGLSVLQGAIINNTTSESVTEFAETYLFEPLGITEYYWDLYFDLTCKTGGGLKLRPRDMAKLGQLYLERGTWKENRLIPDSWIEQSMTKHMDITYPFTNLADGYGYNWWIQYFPVNNQILNSYSARGWGGQYIFVFPQLNMVVVFTQGMYWETDSYYEILQNYILPAVEF